MNIDDFIKKLNAEPEKIDFNDTMDVIESNYHFTETAFVNSQQKNKAGENSGSCKLFAFAKIINLNKQQTLNCFGQYYRDVIANPDGVDHQNIRQFILNGWQGLSFSGDAIVAK